MATHSSILAWKISWTKEPGRLQSMGLDTTEQHFHFCLNQSSFWFISFYRLGNDLSTLHIALKNYFSFFIILDAKNNTFEVKVTHILINKFILNKWIIIDWHPQN